MTSQNMNPFRTLPEEPPDLVVRFKRRNNFRSIYFNHLVSSFYRKYGIDRKANLYKYRRRRRRALGLSTEVVIYLVNCLMMLFLSVCIVDSQSIGFNNYDQQEAFHESPQPLVFMSPSYESGSGLGSSSGKLSNQLKPDHSSSISPSLITAKCWNNYENDNDCKDLNFITQDNSASNNNDKDNDDGNSLITPVLLFESSSPINIDDGGEPSNMQGSSSSRPANKFMAPPYFSSTMKSVQDTSNDRFNNKPKTTANDVYSAPPAGASYLPGSGANNQWPYTTTQNSPSEGRQVVTVRPASVFVATPLPKTKPVKTTTMGRKCRDENDGDCDEPDDAKNGINDNDNSGDDDDDTDDDATNNGMTGKMNGDDMGSNEIGSGQGTPDDDNEADDDQESDEDLEQSSGSSESSINKASSSTSSSQFVEITSIKPSITSTMPRPMRPPKPDNTEASIEVVVHPTLPPTFPITTLSTTSITSQDDPNNSDNNYNPSDSNEINQKSTSTTTFIPDDTIKVKPIYPSTTTELSNSIQESRSDLSKSSTDSPIIDDDLATFKPIPMPDMNPQPPRQDNVESSNGSTIADKYKFDVANPNLLTPASIKFDNPWREKPVYKSQSSHSASQQQVAETWQQQRAKNQQHSKHLDQQAIKPPLNIDNYRPAPMQQQQEQILPTLITYAIIFVLVVILVIFVITTFILKRRNLVRRRALLMQQQQQFKTDQLLMMNSGPLDGNGAPMGGSGGGISNGSNQMMAKLQQPGLLSTYAPSNGILSSDKVTTSIVGKDVAALGVNVDDMIEENGEEEDRLDDEERVRIRNEDDGNEQVESDARVQRARARLSTNNQSTSWSTNTDQTTASSESQRILENNNNRQQHHSPMQQQQHAKTNLANYQQQYHASGSINYNQNSLSDGRQNSSSISGSTNSGSPEAGSVVGISTNPTAYPGREPSPHRQQQHQQHSVMMYNNNGQPLGPANSFAPHDNQFSQPMQMLDMTRRQFHPSRSVENLNNQAFMRNNGVMMNGGQMPHVSMMNQTGQFMPPYSPQMNNGYGPQMHDRARDDARHQMLQHQVSSRGSSMIMQYPYHNQNKILAMNPLATMARRASINDYSSAASPSVSIDSDMLKMNLTNKARGISLYSAEDSSSFITASPSLVRTSSTSTNFAFNHDSNTNGSQVSTPTTIISTTSTMIDKQASFNQFSPRGSNGFGLVTRTSPSLINRKPDRSEAWYV